MSNLLDKSSLVLTPTAYDNGKLLSVKPTDGIGDFDFTRNSSATRVNSQGLIEDVQILSSNLVSNGDFSQEGSELITNGDFATDSDWILGSGWNIGGGKAVAINSASGQKLRQAGQLTASKTYKLVYEVTEITLGGFLPIVGAVAGTAVYSIGTYTEYITTINDDFYIRTLGTTSGSIDNVSVKEVGQDWSITGTGWNISDNGLSGLAAEENVTQSISTIVGKKYVIKFTISNWVSGDVYVRPNNSAGTQFYVNGNGTYTEEFTGVSSSPTLVIRARPSIPFTGTISNISLIEITDDTNLPRIDYTDGVGHWLFEPQSTNTITSSNSGFLAYNMDLAYNNATSPDGTQNAFKATTTTASSSQFRPNQTITTPSTFSIFLKYGNNQWYQIINSSANSFYANIDVQNGVFGTSGAQTDNLSVKDYGNGWYRFSGTFTSASTNGSIRVYASNSSNAGWASVSAPIGSYAYGYGFQVEASSFATSYIPTNGSTVTRLQDAAFGAGSSDLISSTEGVLYAEIAALADDGTNRNISLSKDGDATNRVNIFYRNGSNRIRFIVRVNNINVFDTTINLSNITNYSKVALSFKENEFKVYINGVKEAEQLSGSIFPTDTLDKLGFNQNISGASPFYGKNKCVAVFKEALTDEELTCLTTI